LRESERKQQRSGFERKRPVESNKKGTTPSPSNPENKNQITENERKP